MVVIMTGKKEDYNLFYNRLELACDISDNIGEIITSNIDQ